MRLIATVAAVAVLLVAGVACAHEGHQHDTHQSDMQMAKLHKMMPRYAKAQVMMENSLAKGDLKTVAKQADYLLATNADLQKSKSHKNVENIEEFRLLAGDFKSAAEKVAVAAKKGDAEGARAAFAAMTKICVSCHSSFRGH